MIMELTHTSICKYERTYNVCVCVCVHTHTTLFLHRCGMRAIGDNYRRFIAGLTLIIQKKGS